MIFFSTKLEIENAFRGWCSKTGEKIRVSVPSDPSTMLNWLEECGYLNEEKIQQDFPYPGIKVKECQKSK